MRVEFYNDETGAVHHVHLSADTEEEAAMLAGWDGQFVVCQDLPNQRVELARVVLAHTFTRATGSGTIQ